MVSTSWSIADGSEGKRGAMQRARPCQSSGTPDLCASVILFYFSNPFPSGRLLPPSRSWCGRILNKLVQVLQPCVLLKTGADTRCTRPRSARVKISIPELPSSAARSAWLTSAWLSHRFPSEQQIKQVRAGLVLRWGTTREGPFFCFCAFCFFSFFLHVTKRVVET